MATYNDWWLRPADLPWSSPISEAEATSVSQPDEWRDLIWFNVFNSLRDEQNAAKKDVSAEVRDLLKKRSSARTELLKAWTKNAKISNNISGLVDWSVMILNDMWVSSWDLKKYLTDEWGMEMINNLKTLQNGKFSGEIDNFINWNSPYDTTGMLNQIFPNYLDKYWYTAPEKSEAEKALEAWNLTAGQKFSWWTNTTEWTRTIKKLLKAGGNLVMWVANEVAELGLWWADFVLDLVKWASLQSPEGYLKQLVSQQWQDRYQQLVNAGKYNWTYEQWVKDAYWNYSTLYDKTMNEPWYKDKYENWRDTNKLNWYDENAPMTQVWEEWTKIAEWFAWDKLAKEFLKWVRGAYKWYKWIKAAQKMKWVANVWEADIIAAWRADDIFSALESKSEKELAWNFFDKLSEAFAKSLWDTEPNALSRFLEWGRIGTEMQALDDIHKWEVSKPIAYALSATFNWVLNSAAWLLTDFLWRVVNVPEIIKKSASRLDDKTIDKYTRMAERAATDPRAERPLAYVTKKAVNDAPKKVKEKLASEWAKLWQIRKNMPQTDLTVNSAVETINKWFAENNMWARIVGDIENWFKIEWVPASSEETINNIVKKLNSMLSERNFKIKEWAEIPNSTREFEEFYTALKRIWRTAEKTDKPMFEAIEKWIRDYLDEAIWKEYSAAYAEALAKNAELYWIQDAIVELPKALEQIDKTWWEGVVLSNWMTINELLDYLAKNDFAWNLLEEREVAWWLQSWFKMKPTDTDRVMYPSPAGAAEELQRGIIRALKDPRWNVLKYATPWSKHIGRPISSYWKWYQQPKWETVYGWIYDVISDYVWWRISTNASDMFGRAD